MAERCVCCGAVIPEGRQVCPACEIKREALGYGQISWLRQFGIVSKHWWKQITCKHEKATNPVQVETNVFDREEIFENCTVQVLTNTVTGEVSVGWWQNDNRPESINE